MKRGYRVKRQRCLQDVTHLEASNEMVCSLNVVTSFEGGPGERLRYVQLKTFEKPPNSRLETNVIVEAKHVLTSNISIQHICLGVTWQALSIRTRASGIRYYNVMIMVIFKLIS